MSDGGYDAWGGPMPDQPKVRKDNEMNSIAQSTNLPDNRCPNCMQEYGPLVRNISNAPKNVTCSWCATGQADTTPGMGKYKHPVQINARFEPSKPSLAETAAQVSKVVNHLSNLDLGNYNPSTFEEAIDYIYSQMREIMIGKLRLRGRTNITNQGQLGVANRMCNDKMARILKKTELDYSRAVLKRSGCPEELIERYLGHPDAPVGDTFEDDCLDTGNYATILIMLERGWWDLPLEEEIG